MNVEELRKKHPRFRYDSFEIERTDPYLNIRYNFLLEPAITFRPSLIIPIRPNIKLPDLNSFAFHLGLVEAISYWKAACPSELVVNAGKLEPEQTLWWHDLFIHGLGEFFFRNQIDFTQENFLTIHSTKNAPIHNRVSTDSLSGDLILVGGGKDSIVTLETLQTQSEQRNVFMLNPTPAAREVTNVAGYTMPLIVKRTIDPKLLELNKQEYLNGHTPFSAYLAFLSTFAGLIHGFKHVITSNEQSAGEGNIQFHGLEANHQYSKSFRFEKRFREYVSTYLNSDIEYFSFLRPLYDLQVTNLFVPLVDRYPNFRSCNVNRGESWCGHCPKCAFVYLSLFPFLDDVKLKRTFGYNFFENPAIQGHIADLVGLGEHKPFDCVGTTEESILAVQLGIAKYERLKKSVPEFFQKLRDALNLTDKFDHQNPVSKLTTDWNNTHFLPNEYVRILKNKLSIS